MTKKVTFNKDDTRQHIILLLKYISEGIFEKENILAMSLLCAVAGESLFLLGPPGTAKSLVARRLKLVFKEAKSFEYLMSRFSTPDEIFGPASLMVTCPTARWFFWMRSGRQVQLYKMLC